MKNLSTITATASESPIKNASVINPDGGNEKKSLVATVILTSLVDAFSILVIYLLVSFSSSENILFLSKDTVLPEAVKTEQLINNIVVKIENKKLFVSDKEVTANELFKELLINRKELVKEYAGEEDFKASLTVQADKKVQYKVLNNIILAGSQAGYEEIKFAVLMK